MTRLPAVVALGASLALAGCSGGGGEPAQATASAASAVETAADPGPGRALTTFVAACRRGDTAALWRLLSAPSRAGLGGSYASFRRDAGRELVSWLGQVRPGEEVELSQRIGARWGVAAISGSRLVEGETDADDFAYGAAFRRERGAWRLDLGGLVVGGVRPEPLDEVGPEPEFRADVAAGGRVRAFLLWLDGRALQAASEADSPFAARVRARPTAPLAEGLHVGVAFAATDAASAAVAWPFRVEP
jgi:hypothetical protein